MFRDRVDAGRQLAQRLLHLRDDVSPPVVLGLPRGGMVVAAEVARELNAPLDVLVVRKIGAPHQPELALGAVTDGESPQYVLNQDLVDALGVSEVHLKSEIAEQLVEVQRRQKFYRGGRSRVPLASRAKSVCIGRVPPLPSASAWVSSKSNPEMTLPKRLRSWIGTSLCPSQTGDSFNAASATCSGVSAAAETL